MSLTVDGWTALASRRDRLVRALYRWRRVDAEDIAQDALLAAWEFRHSFEPSKTTAWGWLLTIAHRHASWSSRRVEKYGMASLDADDAAEPHAPAWRPEEHVDRRREVERVRRKISVMAPRARATMLLACQGWEPCEIGEALEISPRSVSVTLSLGRDRLRRGA